MYWLEVVGLSALVGAVVGFVGIAIESWMYK
jgi:hypothetical protein